MDTTNQPKNYSPLPNIPPTGADQTTPNKRNVIVVVLVVLAVVLLSLVGVMIYRNSMNAKSSMTPVTPTVAPATPTPTGAVSQDDSVDTMEQEVEKTTVDDFSSDDKIIESDTNRL